MRLANILYQEGERSAALEKAGRAVELRPEERALPDVLRAAIFADRGDLATAERLARSAIASRPDLGPAHHALAIILEKQGRHEEAVASYRAAIERFHTIDAYTVRVQLADLLLTIGRPGEAAPLLRETLERYPLNDTARELLGEAEAMSARSPDRSSSLPNRP
jgi:tetratricopeptide (TPR) repeat protein